MAYYGKISPEFASGLEISERNYMYQLLIETIEEEKKQNKKEEEKAKAAASRIKSASRRTGRR